VRSRKGGSGKEEPFCTGSETVVTQLGKKGKRRGKTDDLSNSRRLRRTLDRSPNEKKNRGELATSDGRRCQDIKHGEGDDCGKEREVEVICSRVEALKRRQGGGQ